MQHEKCSAIVRFAKKWNRFVLKVVCPQPGGTGNPPELNPE